MNCCQGLGSKMLRCRTFKVKLRLDRLSVLKADRSSTTIYIPVKALGCFRLRFVISSSWAASAQFAFVLPDVPQACQNVFDTSLYQSQKKTKYTNTRQANVEPAKQMQTLLNPTCTPLQNLQTPKNPIKFVQIQISQCPSMSSVLMRLSAGVAFGARPNLRLLRLSRRRLLRSRRVTQQVASSQLSGVAPQTFRLWPRRVKLVPR